MLFYDAMDDGQPQAGSLAHLPGGKKRIENFCQVFLINALAGVGNGKFELAGLFEGGDWLTFLRRSSMAYNPVDDQVQQDLLDAPGVHGALKILFYLNGHLDIRGDFS